MADLRAVGPEDRRLIEAAWRGDSVEIQRLLEGGASLHAPCRESGMTPLILAVKEGHVNAVRLLLAAGAKPDATNQAGETALSVAQGAGLADVVDALKKAGAPR